MAPNKLFSPASLGGLELSNRVVMAPMTRSMSPGGTPGPDVAAYYARRAGAGVGLILTEGVGIDRPASRNGPDVPRINGEGPIEGWRAVATAVHREHGRIGMQLWHVGSMPNSGRTGGADWLQPDPVESPSGLVSRGQPRGIAMTEQMIEATVSAYATGAAQAKKLGFDLVEIHGAHGFLVDQFFWEETNRRTDRYGGTTLAERATFATDVVRAVRDAVGPAFPISFRISQWKQQDYMFRSVGDPDALGQWLRPVVEAGVDILHCSQRRYWEAEFPHIDGTEGLNLAGWVKKVTGLPTITVGSVGLADDFLPFFEGRKIAPARIDTLLARLEKDEFDLVAVGRALLSDPDWVEKIKAGDPDSMRPFDKSALGTLS